MNALQDWHNRGVEGYPAAAQPGIGYREAVEAPVEVDVLAGLQPEPAADGLYLTGLDPVTGMPERPRRSYTHRISLSAIGGVGVRHM